MSSSPHFPHEWTAYAVACWLGTQCTRPVAPHTVIERQADTFVYRYYATALLTLQMNDITICNGHPYHTRTTEQRLNLWFHHYTEYSLQTIQHDWYLTTRDQTTIWPCISGLQFRVRDHQLQILSPLRPLPTHNLRLHDPTTPPSTLAHLSLSANPYIQTAIALHPNTPPALLTTLSHRRHGSIRRALLQNPHTPAAIRTKLALLAP